MNYRQHPRGQGRSRRETPSYAQSGQPETALSFGRSGWRRPAHNVPVNIIDHGDHFTAHIYAVGFAKADIEILVSGDTLYIAGKRIPSDPSPDFLLQEFPIKHFERSFELSEHADRTGISATIDEAGVLVITVTKLPSATAPELRIRVD